ncbi:MAG: hypothetical protein ACRDQZ_23380, partial [Mycobacteriales bacterium]
MKPDNAWLDGGDAKVASYRIRPRLLGLAFMMGVLQSVAHGQSANSDSSETAGLQEIVVTAEKRSEDIKEVPVSVTVLS